MVDEHVFEKDPWFPIAERVKAERKRAGLTRQQLAVKVGVSRGTIFNWESGKRIPIEKCAPLAAGLEVPADEILALHPEVPKLGAPAQVLPEAPDSVRFTRREVSLFAVVGAALLIGMGFLTWSTANASCTEIGAGNGTAAPQFRAAYDAGGGRIPLGCAVEDVRKWGPGLSQRIDGGELGEGAILALDRFGEAFVFSGDLWESFRWISDGASTDVAGYPVSPPLDCGGTLLVALAGGSDGPGALVQQADGSSYQQISGSAWVAYISSGGPAGPLGRPVATTTDSNGDVVMFEGGMVTAHFGALPIVESGGTSAPALDLDACTEVNVIIASDL